ncbi:MAG: hypothetical protein ACI3WR_03715 [Oscillospiraceae bacterium]
MREKNEQDLYQTLSDTQQLLKGLDPSGERYTLESILEEFGTKSAAEPETDVPPQPEPETAPSEEERAADTPAESGEESVPAGGPAQAAPQEDGAAPEEPLPPSQPPQEDFAFESVVAETVGAVLGEEKRENRRRAGLQERLAARAAAWKSRRSRKKAEAAEEEEDEEAAEARRWREEAEPPAEETYAALRQEYGKLKKRFRLSLLPAALSLLLLAAEELELLAALLPPAGMALALLLLQLFACVCGWPVFRRAAQGLKEKRFTAELMTLLACLATAADGCAAALSSGPRPGTPLCPVSALAVSFALLGQMLETRGRKDSFRLLCVGEPGCVVAEGGEGIFKQKGSAAGFTHAAFAPNAAARWQGVLLPLIFAAAVVFTALATVGQGRNGEFCWCLSALLTAANAFTLPLCFGLPYARAARRLYHSGAAVAGYLGARLISRSRRMILTDRDLFPEGTVHLNGIKIYGEEIGKVVSYAASLARRSGSGLSHLFDGLLQSEGAALEKVDEFAWSDYGGFSAVIHGETVHLGTERFLRRSDVVIPHGANLKNALFLAVDKRMIAAFAVKYPQVSSAEWALHSLRRNGVAPVLASRDPNLTPALLKQRFGTDARAVYPKLSERLALSEPGRQRPGLMGAALYREGLMPYAEAVIASRRLCRVTRQLTVLALAGSVVSLLLCFYLVFAGAGASLSPLSLAVYQLLWAFGGLLIGLGTDRY